MTHPRPSLDLPQHAVRWPCRQGHTLIELVAASALVIAALVPALKLMREGLELSRSIDVRDFLVTYAASKLDEQLALSSAAWTPGSESGNFASDGYANVRFQANWSDTPAEGGIPDRLMAVRVTVWDDQNGSGSLDRDEPQVAFRSKVARLASYEDQIPGI